jgi:hypothetical protein
MTFCLSDYSNLLNVPVLEFVFIIIIITLYTAFISVLKVHTCYCGNISLSVFIQEIDQVW